MGRWFESSRERTQTQVITTNYSNSAKTYCSVLYGWSRLIYPHLSTSNPLKVKTQNQIVENLSPPSTWHWFIFIQVKWDKTTDIWKFKICTINWSVSKSTAKHILNSTSWLAAFFIFKPHATHSISSGVYSNKMPSLKLKRGFIWTLILFLFRGRKSLVLRQLKHRYKLYFWIIYPF